jgi:hypothetical protein
MLWPAVAQLARGTAVAAVVLTGFAALTGERWVSLLFGGLAIASALLSAWASRQARR